MVWIESGSLRVGIYSLIVVSGFIWANEDREYRSTMRKEIFIE
jgi:hypothetical protein